MARVEKTVFISYRRKDISWALAVYQYLTSQKYDVFFDYTSLSGGDFEQVIVSNIRARAHFVLILTPTALDRCGEPGDWLRREIETAIEEKRNIIPLFFDGFSFSSHSVVEKLTGNLAAVNRYNGLEVPAGYFMEAMERLRSRYLNVPLDAVLHPVPTGVRKVVKEEQVAANKALEEKKKNIEELVKPVKEKHIESPSIEVKAKGTTPGVLRGKVVGEKISTWVKKPNLRLYGISFGILLVVAIGFFGIKNLTGNVGRTTTSPKDGMVLVYVPGGKFAMGSEDGEKDEKPVHTLNLDVFWIDQTEVTNKMYNLCVEAGVCDEPYSKSSFIRSNYYGNPEFENYPVIHVDYDNAKVYCEWAERRLPTEAEWEKAARGKYAFVYPWGDNLPTSDLLNYNRVVGDTVEVGSYKSGTSPYGALDMAGNVWEWVADWYDPSYYLKSPLSNPPGPDSGFYGVLRGGAWGNIADYVRSSHRFEVELSFTSHSAGFRCAKSASE